MVQRLKEKGLDVDTREGSYTDLLFSEAAYQIYKGLSYHPTLLAAAVPSEESGPYLDKFGGMFGLSRTPAATAHVLLAFSGEDGAEIPQGTVAVSNGRLRFTTIQKAVISEGTGPGYRHGGTARGGVQRGGGDGDPAGHQSVRRHRRHQQGAGRGRSRPGKRRLLLQPGPYLPGRACGLGNANHYKQWARSVAGVGSAAVTHCGTAMGQ